MSQSISQNETIEQPLDNIIYKVNLVLDNKIKKIYVFNGEKNTKQNTV